MDKSAQLESLWDAMAQTISDGEHEQALQHADASKALAVLKYLSLLFT